MLKMIQLVGTHIHLGVLGQLQHESRHRLYKIPDMISGSEAEEWNEDLHTSSSTCSGSSDKILKEYTGLTEQTTISGIDYGVNVQFCYIALPDM